jgi:hypothetical protein
MKSTMQRARFAADRTQLLRPHDQRLKSQPFNFVQHSFAHAPAILIYESKATLDTNAGSILYLQQDAVIESVQASVAGAPSGSALVWDVLIGTNSIFANTAERPQIKAGDTLGRLTVPSRAGWSAGAGLRAQGITVSSATGPLILTFQLTLLS